MKINAQLTPCWTKSERRPTFNKGPAAQEPSGGSLRLASGLCQLCHPAGHQTVLPLLFEESFDRKEPKLCQCARSVQAWLSSARLRLARVMSACMCPPAYASLSHLPASANSTKAHTCPRRRALGALVSRRPHRTGRAEQGALNRPR